MTKADPVTKYRYEVSEEDCPGIGLGWDDDLPTYHTIWKLSKSSRHKNAEKLENYIPPTKKQADFLLRYSDEDKTWVATRTKKEASNRISSIIDGWEYEKRIRELNPDPYEEEDLFFDGDHCGG